MVRRLQLMEPERRGFGARLAAAAGGLRDGLLRDNKVLPPVLGALALIVFAWLLAGLIIGDPQEERVARQAAQPSVAQAPEDGGGGSSETPAPGVENRDNESLDVYESKDPFRELIPTSDAGGAEAGGDTSGDTGSDTSGDGGSGTGDNGSGTGGTGSGTGAGGGGTGSDDGSGGAASDQYGGGGGDGSSNQTSPGGSGFDDGSGSGNRGGGSRGGPGNGNGGGNGSGGSGPGSGSGQYGGDGDGNGNLFDSGGNLRR